MDNGRKWFLGIILLCMGFIFLSCQVGDVRVTPKQDPVSHTVWNDLLQQYVAENGFVDYKGFIKDSFRLNEYLDLLSASHPQKKWSKNEQKAYWINAYNAFTVKMVVDHYPVASIKDIKSGISFVNSVWDVKFINIQGQEYDLNNIEHSFLRKKFPDGRVHAAINCASFSCPPLRNEAYVADRLEEQLDEAMQTFINNPSRNRVSKEKAELSKIFRWFSADFKEDGKSVIDFVNKYAKDPVSKDAEVIYLDYDWTLNEQ